MSKYKGKKYDPQRYHNDPEFRAKWDAQTCAFKKNPETLNKAVERSIKTRKEKAEFRKMMNNPTELRDTALKALLENDPEVFNKIVASLAEKAATGDKQAIQKMISIGGLEAPKKTEHKEIPVTAEEASQRLREIIKNKQAG